MKMTRLCLKKLQDSEDTSLFYEVANSDISRPFEPAGDDLNLFTSSEVEKVYEDATNLFGDVQNLFDLNVDFNVNIAFSLPSTKSYLDPESSLIEEVLDIQHELNRTAAMVDVVKASHDSTGNILIACRAMPR